MMLYFPPVLDRQNLGTVLPVLDRQNLGTVLDSQSLGTVFPRLHPTIASHERIPRPRPLYPLAKKAVAKKADHFHCMNHLAGVAVP